MLLYSILFSQKLHLWYPGDVSSHAFCGASSSCNWLVGRFSQTLQPQIHPSIHPSIKFLLNIFHLFFVVSLAYLNLLVSLKLLKGQQHLSSLHVFRSSWCLVCSVQSNCQPRTWDACFTNYRLWSTCSYCCASRLSTSLSVLVDPVIFLLTRRWMQTTKACRVSGKSSFFLKPKLYLRKSVLNISAAEKRHCIAISTLH